MQILSRIVIAAIASIVSIFLPLRTVRAQNLASFAVLSGSAITNTGPSVITGNVGLSPGTAITGFPPGTVVPPSAIFNSDATAIQAQIDLFNFYNNLSAMPATQDLSGQNLGGLTLTPGVYSFSSAAQLTGSLTLNALGNPNATFIFNIGSTLTTASASSILLINGAQGSNVFFRVGSSATLGTTTAFVGDIVALTSITLDAGAGIDCGAALAHNGAVTLDDNTITVCMASVTLISSILGGSASANQIAIANTLDAFIAAGGVLPPAFLNLLTTLSPAALAAGLTQLSGEAATGAPPAGIQAMNSFLSLVLNPFDDREVTTSPPDQAPLVYKPPLYKALAGFSPPEPRRWSTWVAAYGGESTTNGDVFAGTHDRSVGTYGIALGLDYRVAATTVGFALAGGGTNFGLADSLGSGASDLFQAAIYSRTYFDAAYVAAALAYGWDRVSTSRDVTLAGTDNLTAAFSAEQVAGRIEGGYRFAAPNILGLPGHQWFVPYAALQMQAFYTPSYGESAAAGSSVFALNYAAQTTTATRTELGAWFDQVIAQDKGTILALRTRTAWAHDDWSGLNISAAFQSVPGSGFTVYGALPSANSLLVSAGMEIAFKNGYSIGCWLDSELAQRSQTYSGNARLRYAF